MKLGEPKQTEDDFNEDNEAFGMPFVSPSGKRWVETMPAHSGRRYSANILCKKGGIAAYATQRIHDIVSSFKCIFDQSMLDTIIVETNRKCRRVKGNEWKDVTSMKMKAYFGLCILRGVFKGNNESVLELGSPVSGRPIFGNIWQSIGLKTFVGCYALITELREWRNFGMIKWQLLVCCLMALSPIVKNVTYTMSA